MELGRSGHSDFVFWWPSCNYFFFITLILISRTVCPLGNLTEGFPSAERNLNIVRETEKPSESLC